MVLYINEVEYDLIDFENIKDNLTQIKYKNEPLTIIPDIFLNTYGISEKFGFKKIAIIIDKEINKEFINLIEKIYEKCKQYIDQNEVANPLRDNKNGDKYILDLTLQKDFDGNILTKFYNLDKKEDNLLNYEEMENRQFIIYPCINIEKITISANDKGYIQFTLKEAYIKFKNKSVFDFNKVLKAYNNFDDKN